MNFFEHQDRAQRNTFRLIGLFAISVVLITVVVNLFAHLLVFGLFHRISDPSFLYPLFLLVTIVTAAFIGVAVALQVQQGRGDAVVSVVALVSILLSLVANWYILQFFQFVSRDASTGAIIRFHVCVSLGTIVCISLVSVYRIYQLRGGGDRIAAELGGVWVDPETTHPLRRRLINVVEEVSLASGVPMPFIYVLERELGINALAVGYSVEDAVVVVSQGALERLNRDELQGMVAHEFTHILNGDMRANIRMMGILFGILGISAIGSLLMQGSLHQNTGSDRKTSGNPIAIAIGMVFWIVGYIGVFSGRLIRAGVSRQREFLADASAVQFTRNPDGLVGALIKISKIKDGSVVHMTRREEVCHMFFAAGQPFWGQFLSTHPPLIDRIRAIKPDFQPDAALAATPSATYVKKVGHAGALAFSTGSQPIPGSVAQNKETVPAIDAFTATLRADRDRPDPQHLSAAIRTLSLM
ncbi:M48 family metallopeptidase, partial [Desulfosarcina sp. OttesenSCG-928-G10]|nr:M48 family metallopeptidase [Desulfosarcina sp. OttesenSCG-928-G10]